VDSNGNNKWGVNANTNGTSFSFGIAKRNNNEVVIAGCYPGKLLWQGANIVPNHAPNQSYDVFITRFNLHTGEVLGVDTLASSFGYDDEPGAMASDGNGNVYVGGYFSADLRVPGDTLENIGGQTDFFVAKYGCNCGATLANYTANVNDAVHTADFTYTGSAPYDSLKWSFGDNNTATTGSDTISHSYALPGTYQVCVTVYTACDSNTYCQTVQVAVGVTNVPGMADVIIYPNPSADELHIDHAAIGTTVRIYNIMGQQVYTATIHGNQESIPMKAFPIGNYLLELRSTDGVRAVTKMEKR
jgi:hypothetical protein